MVGLPKFFIEANLAIESAKRVSPFHRLMIAQDTGSAIVGPARADLYWGAGEEAASIANRIRNSGRFVMLLPRELDMIAAGRHMPLPAPKPKFAEALVSKHNMKGNADTAKSQLDPRVSAAYARGVAASRTDREPSGLRLAPQSLKKRLKRTEYETTGIAAPTINGNSNRPTVRSHTRDAGLGLGRPSQR